MAHRPVRPRIRRPESTVSDFDPHATQAQQFDTTEFLLEDDRAFVIVARDVTPEHEGRTPRGKPNLGAIMRKGLDINTQPETEEISQHSRRLRLPEGRAVLASAMGAGVVASAAFAFTMGKGNQSEESGQHAPLPSLVAGVSNESQPRSEESAVASARSRSHSSGRGDKNVEKDALNNNSSADTQNNIESDNSGATNNSSTNSNSPRPGSSKRSPKKRKGNKSEPNNSSSATPDTSSPESTDASAAATPAATASTTEIPTESTPAAAEAKPVAAAQSPAPVATTAGPQPDIVSAPGEATPAYSPYPEPISAAGEANTPPRP